MNLHFAAEEVGIEMTEFDVFVIGFYTEEHYLMIQQAEEDVEVEEEATDMNSYHIERDDQSWGGYGGVEKITLQPHSISVELDEVGQDHLECTQITVDFQVEEEVFEELEAGLRKIFGDRLVVA